VNPWFGPGVVGIVSVTRLGPFEASTWAGDEQGWPSSGQACGTGPIVVGVAVTVPSSGTIAVASETVIARANHRISYPSRIQLIAAMNPCRCGRAYDPSFNCKRGPNVRCAAEYQTRLSGPLLDRIDLHVEVPAVTAADLVLPPPAEGSRQVAARVAAARAIAAERLRALGRPELRTNAELQGSLLEAAAAPEGSGLSLLREAAEAMRLSARGYHRVLKVARTIADLDGAEHIGRPHLAEALAYRALNDRMAIAA